MMGTNENLQRALKVIGDDNATHEALSSAIGAIPGLIKRVSTYARVFYPRISADLSSPDRALSLLGARAIREIAVHHTVIKRVEGFGLPDEVTDVLWLDLISRGVAARMIATSSDSQVSPDSAFTAGVCLEAAVADLLSRAGEYASWYRDVRTKMPEHRGTAEAALFGKSAEDTFSETLSQWSFPLEIDEAILIRNHMGPHPDPCDLIGVCWWADRLCSALTAPDSCGELSAWVDGAGTALGLSEEDAWDLIALIVGGIAEAAQTLGVSIAPVADLELVRGRSVSALDQFSMTDDEVGCWTGLLACQVSRLQTRLRALTDNLEVDDGRDGLTGMLGLRAFLDTLEGEVAHARAQSQSLWLILLDIDDFSVINAEDGYDVGDAVLTKVAGIMRRLLPEAREMARVGPDAMVAILTGDEWRIRITSERMRAAVEMARFQIDGQAMRVTVSVAVLGLDGVPGHASHENFLGAVMLQQRGRSRRLANQITWGRLSPV